MSLFAAGCAERNLNPIETGKSIWIPGLMNGCGSCVLSSHSEMEKKKSLRQMSDLNVHVADNHKAEKRILSNDLTSDFFSEVNGHGFWLQRRLEIPKFSLHSWWSRNPCSMIHFSETPSMIMLPLHKKRKLYLLSFLWIQSTSKASEREPAHILCFVTLSSACHPNDPPSVSGQPGSSAAIPCQLKDLLSINDQQEAPYPLTTSGRGPPTIEHQ